MITVAFVSGFLSAHQEPFCTALYKNPETDFHFIASTPLSDGRKAMGWNAENAKPYEIRAYNSPEEKSQALDIMTSCDVLIIGTENYFEEYFSRRMKNKNAVTIRFSERLYKRGLWQCLSPRGLYYKWKTYYKYFNNNLYMFCASAYTAFDYALTGAYINKCFKWGYFPPLTKYDVTKVLSEKQPGSILWVGRMLDWKHPEAMVDLAEYLLLKKIDFNINLIGDGPMKESLENLIEKKGLSNHLHLLGALPPDKVQEHMRRSSVFCATSDRYEGWGAVINEAMNNCCAVVASAAMGSVPFLIRNKHNGISYKHGKFSMVFNDIENLLNDNKLRDKMAANAYSTIEELWNSDVAADRFVMTIKALLNKNDKKKYLFADGPCSKAKVIKKGE